MDRKKDILLIREGEAIITHSFGVRGQYNYCIDCINLPEGRCYDTVLTPSGVCGNYDPIGSVDRYNEVSEGMNGFGPKVEGTDASPKIEPVKECFKWKSNRKKSA